MLKQKHLPSALFVGGRDVLQSPAPIYWPRGVFVLLLSLRMVWSVTILRRMHEDPQRAVFLGRLIRVDLERLGGMWIKAGRLLAAADVHPQTFRDELARIRDHSPPMGVEVVKRIIEGEIGQPTAHVFREFDVVPVTTNSVNQVHQAWLRDDGVKVAIRVLRPGARRAFLRDMSIFAKVIFCARFFPLVPWVMLDGLRSELEKIVDVSTEYRKRAEVMREMRRQIGTKSIYVPKVFSRYCTERMLVVEFIDGLSIADYHHARTVAPKKAQLWARRNGIRPRKLFRRFDPSMRIIAGNDIFMLRNNRIAIIDANGCRSIDGTSAIMNQNVSQRQLISSST